MARRNKKSRDTQTETPVHNQDNPLLANGTPSVDKEGKTVMWVGASSLVAAALGLGFFFMSDIPEHIKTYAVSKQQAPAVEPLHVTSKDIDQSVTLERPSTEQIEQAFVRLLEQKNVTKSDIVTFLDGLSPAEFKQVHRYAVDHVDIYRVRAYDDVSSYLIQVVSGGLSTKEDIVKALQRLDESTVHDAIRMYQKGKSPKRAKKATLTTLEEAYQEAERRYPNQVDGDKRLRLIADRNASSYYYYVVEPRDTLLELSQDFDVPLGQLLSINGIEDADVIHAGMILLLPSDTPRHVTNKK